MGPGKVFIAVSTWERPFLLSLSKNASTFAFLDQGHIFNCLMFHLDSPLWFTNECMHFSTALCVDRTQEPVWAPEVAAGDLQLWGRAWG